MINVGTFIDDQNSGAVFFLCHHGRELLQIDMKTIVAVLRYSH